MQWIQIQQNTKIPEPQIPPLTSPNIDWQILLLHIDITKLQNTIHIIIYNNTHILATSITPWRQVNSESFNFSISL